MAATALRALVVATGRSRGSLSAVRALYEAGWTVGVGTPDGRGMITRSNAAHRAHLIPRPRQGAAAFSEAVRAAVEQEGYDVVFGGADDWVAALARHRTEIPATVAHPPIEVVERTFDKLELTSRAAAVGWAVPRTEPATDEALARWTGPVIVKCRTHCDPAQRSEHRVEARWYPDVHRAVDRVVEVRAAGVEPLLQEAVDGQLQAIIGLHRHGRLHGRVQQRTFRLWPTPSGVSARAETVPVDEDLAARAAALLEDLGWTGLTELQFLRRQDGTPVLIDVNGRFYGSMALANVAGGNLADAWGRQALGLPVPELTDGTPGVRFTWGAGDVRRAAVERRGGLVPDVLGSLAWAARAHKSVLDLRDLGPTIDLTLDRVAPRGRSERAYESVSSPS